MTQHVRVSGEFNKEPDLGLLVLALIEIARGLEADKPVRRQKAEGEDA